MAIGITYAKQQFFIAFDMFAKRNFADGMAVGITYAKHALLIFYKGTNRLAVHDPASP